MKRLLLPLLLGFVIANITPNLWAQSTDTSIVASVKTKNGKKYNFTTFHIGAMIYSTQGYMVGGAEQWYDMFKIKINDEDVITRLSIKDVKKIKFVQVKEGSFKLIITTSQKQVWKVSLLGPYRQLPSDAGINGKENKKGVIDIPYNKIDSVIIIDPKSIRECNDFNFMTEAKVY